MAFYLFASAGGCRLTTHTAGGGRVGGGGQDRQAGLLRQMHQQGRPARVETPRYGAFVPGGRRNKHASSVILLLIYRSVRFRGEGDQAHAAGPCNDEVPAQHQQPQQHVCDNLRVNQQHLGEA